MQSLFHRDSLMFFRKIISSFIVLTFLTSLVVVPAGGQVFLDVATSINANAGYQPPVLLGLKIHPENPLLFDFIVDQGQSKLSTDELKEETTKLVKYFLAALTIPDKEVWVNLSPTEKDRIIPDVLGQTTMGKTMLEQDYVLKQLAASLTNPETDLGKKYWEQVNGARTLDVRRWTLEKTPSVQPPATSDFNKVWIMPEKAEVLESNGIVLVGEKRLKVMLDEEYQAVGAYCNTPLQKNVISSQIFRTTILPTIEKAVNEGKEFADVRQIYNSVILAAWYKKALKESLLGKIYTDKGKVAGVETDDKTMKQRIYEQYLAAFKKGAYNLIKEEADENGDLIPRKYFSGGIEIAAFGDGARSSLTERTVSLRQVEGRIEGISSSVAVTVQLAATKDESGVVSSAATQGEDVIFAAASNSLRQDPSRKVSYGNTKYHLSTVIKILEELVNYWDGQEDNPDKFATHGVHGKIITSVQLLSAPGVTFSLDDIRFKSIFLDNLVKQLKVQNIKRLDPIRLFQVWVSQDFKLNFAISNSQRVKNITIEDARAIFFRDLLPLIRDELQKYSDNADPQQAYWRTVSERTSVLLSGPVQRIQAVLDASYDKFHQTGHFHDLNAILSDPSRGRLRESFSNIQNVIAEVLGDTQSFASQKAVLVGQQTYPQTEKAAYVNESFIHATLVSDIFSSWKQNVRFREKLASETSRVEKPLVQVKGVHLMPDLSVAFELQEVRWRQNSNVLKTVKETAAQLAEDNGQAPRYFPDTLAATVAYLFGNDISRSQLLELNSRFSEINIQLQKDPITFFIDEMQLQSGTKKGFVVTRSKTLKFSASSGVDDKVNVASAPVGGLDRQVGGIDFDPTSMNLQIKRDGRGVPLPLPQQNLEQINIQGLFPVIINITPINAQTLPIFLGFTRPNSGGGQSFESFGGQVPKEPAKEIEQVAGT